MSLSQPRLSRKVLALHDEATVPAEDDTSFLPHRMSASAGARSGATRPARGRRSRPQSAPSRPTRPMDWEEFLRRQTANEGLVRRSLHASVRRACLEQKHITKNALSGNQGRRGFCDFLRRQYGTVLAGWRTMDLDQKGYLCFQEFCQSCREMLFDGDVRSLWRELACQRDFITLKEVCPEVARHVCAMKKVILQLYGNMMTGWWKSLDRDRKGFVTEPEFVAAIRLLQKKAPEYKAEPHELFRMFVPSGAGKLSLAEFDPRTWSKICSGELRREKPQNVETWRRLSAKCTRYCPYRPYRPEEQVREERLNGNLFKE